MSSDILSAFHSPSLLRVPLLYSPAPLDFAYFSLIFTFFLLLRFKTFNCPIFKFIDSSACSNLPLKLVKFSFQLLYLSATKYHFGFFLDFLFLYWYLYFVHAQFSPDSLYIFLQFFEIFKDSFKFLVQQIFQQVFFWESFIYVFLIVSNGSYFPVFMFLFCCYCC